MTTSVNEILKSLGFTNTIEEIKTLLLENGTNQYQPTKNGNNKFSKFGEQSFHILQAAWLNGSNTNIRTAQAYGDGENSFSDLVLSIQENGFDISHKIKVSFSTNNNQIVIVDGNRRFLALLFILVDGIKNGNLDTKFASYLNTIPCEYLQNNLSENEIFGKQLQFSQSSKIDNQTLMSLVWKFIQNDPTISTKTISELLKVTFTPSILTKISQFRKFSHIEPIREKFFNYQLSLIDAYNIVLDEKENVKTLESDEIQEHFSNKIVELEKTAKQTQKENKPLKLKVEKKPKQEETPKEETKKNLSVESEESFLYNNLNNLFDVLAVSEHKNFFKAIKILLEKGQDSEIQKTTFSNILGLSKVPEMALQALEEKESEQTNNQTENLENELNTILEKLEDETTKESTRLSEICVNFDSIEKIESNENLLLINDRTFQMTSNTEAKAFEIFLKDLYAVK